MIRQLVLLIWAMSATVACAQPAISNEPIVLTHPRPWQHGWVSVSNELRIEIPDDDIKRHADDPEYWDGIAIEDACENFAALPGPMPLTRSTMSFQSLKAPVLRASRILPDRPGPMPLTVSSSAWLAWLASTAAKASPIAAARAPAGILRNAAADVPAGAEGTAGAGEHEHGGRRDRIQLVPDLDLVGLAADAPARRQVAEVELALVGGHELSERPRRSRRR